jgi:glutamate racemase
LAKIVVFDSGLGSISIIKEIKKIMKTDIVYFADQKNYPYGNKSQAQIASIIKKTINMLEEKFTPDIIVVASNTPSLMLNLQTGKIIDVKPPLKLAQKKSKSKKIGILATKASVNSKGLVNYVKESNIPKAYKIFKINGSNLVDLVESGKFLNKKNYCKKIIKKSLDDYIITEKIDTITLSSTHLLFLKTLLEKEFPQVEFIDPGSVVAKKIFLKIKNKQSKRNSLKIFTSGNIINFENKLKKIGIKNKINYLST